MITQASLRRAGQKKSVARAQTPCPAKPPRQQPGDVGSLSRSGSGRCPSDPAGSASGASDPSSSNLELPWRPLSVALLLKVAALLLLFWLFFRPELRPSPDVEAVADTMFGRPLQSELAPPQSADQNSTTQKERQP